MQRGCLIVKSVVCGAGLVLACAWGLPTALAQAPSRAEVLFNDGLSNMKAGRYEQACPALAESYRMDPLPGVLFTQAECEAAWGRIATALGHYQEFLRLLTTLEPEKLKRHHERRQIATEKIAALSRLAPQLTIVAPPGAPEGLVVKRNGLEVSAPKLGVAIAVDPGTYVVSFEVPGRRPIDRRVELAPAAAATVGADVVLAPVGASSTAGSREQRSEPGAAAPRTPVAAYVLGGVGLAALGGFVGFAASGKSRENDLRDDPCAASSTCAPADIDKVKQRYVVADVLLGAGIVSLGAATVIYLAWPSKAPAAARMPVDVAPIPGGSMAVLRGRF